LRIYTGEKVQLESKTMRYSVPNQHGQAVFIEGRCETLKCILFLEYMGQAESYLQSCQRAHQMDCNQMRHTGELHPRIQSLLHLSGPIWTRTLWFKWWSLQLGMR